MNQLASPTVAARTACLLAITAFVATFASTTASAQQRTSLDGIWEIRREQEPDTAYQPVHVPGAFETVLGKDFDGIARYRLELPLPKARTDRVYAEFDAVATHAQVFVNGRRVAEHLGGWTPFRADLTRHLKWNGEDTLEVLVDERVGHNTQSAQPVIQPHFGGIWQGVTLCCNQTPTLNRHDVFVFGNDTGEVTVLAGVVAGKGQVSGLCIELLDGETVVVSETRNDLNSFAGPLTIPEPQLWRPGSPHLYTARLTLFVNDKPVDTISRRFGCRGLHTDGTRIVWNGSSLQVRGILHRGYSPPALAPPTDPEYWRGQLEYFRSLGFNTIKCCLWIPPDCFHDLCDELGMLVWQEYPTWHPQMDQAHTTELLREHNEFFRLDRSHPSVAFRSITCETGRSTDLNVVRTFFDACKTMVPDTLVVDDSSFIGWQGVTDLWSEHPSGNNSWFPGGLKGIQENLSELGAKPLLLDECIAAHTWVDRNAWLSAHGTQDLWWRPLCWDSQTKAEQWLTEQFGSATLATLASTAKTFAMRNRKFQIEQLRLRIPEAGYTVSAARDFANARTGLFDDLDRPKFTEHQWRWQRDTMLCLDLDWDQRDVVENQGVVPIRISHYGHEQLKGELKIWCEGTDIATTVPVNVAPGTTSERFTIKVECQQPGLHKLRIRAELTGSHQASNQWNLWHSPMAWHYRLFAGIIKTDRLTPDLIDQMVAGARVLLHVGDAKHTLHNESIWELKGAAFAPEHPIHRRLPRDLLLQEASFELASGRVIPWQPWIDQVDPILAFWETHDIADVRMHLQAFDTNVGKGRLLASSLNTSGPVHSLRYHVDYLLQQHLTSGPKPKRSLSQATISALLAKMQEKTIDLPTWRFRMDPDDLGRTNNWHDPKIDTSTKDWRDLKAGSHWENQGDDLKHFTGIGWYRVDVDVPADWRGIDARCVLEGVDDSFHIWLNGELLGVFGDEASKTTIWLEQQVAELQQKLRPGKRNTIVLRVVDHAGAGGLWQPVRLTTGPTDNAGKLLR